ncbi:MAG: LytTR family transcriptional regulator DNA-binding domain-containing protein [Rikenellaceae bacterium]|nr:LytTR family transcriptional regulator DNA-binding domain-containing protein [Rikenellaceae bacterium]
MTPIPSFIYKKKNQITMVLFVPLFALLFILIYKPLDFATLDEKLLPHIDIAYDLKLTLLSIAMILIGMAVAAISRIIMNAYTRKHAISYVKYIAWVALEIMIMVLIYTTVTYFLIDLSGADTLTNIFRNTLIKAILILLIPYVGCYIYFIWQERVRELRAIRKRLEEDEHALQRAYIQIYDDKGKMQLSVHREKLLVIESADNYVCVWYLNGDQPKKVMVRATLKQVAQQLADTHVVRCHRSYMINLDHIKVLRREKEGIFAEFGVESVPDIPISKTYAESITRFLIS